MIKSALRTALGYRLKLPESGDPLLTSTVLDDMMRHALNDISREYDWAWLLTSASITFDTTTGLAALPVGYVRGKHLYIGTSATSQRRGRYCNLGEYLDAKAIGSSYVWTDLGANIELSRLPVTVPVAKLHYQQQEPALATDAASPLLPEQYQDVMLARAAYHSEIRRGQASDSMVHDNEYQLELKKMKKQTVRVSGPRRIVAANNNWATW